MVRARLITPRSGESPSLSLQPVHFAPSTIKPLHGPAPNRCEPRWRAEGEPLKQAVQRLTALLEKHEPPRKRQRRANDQATFHRAIECIACNLVAVSLGAPDRPLAIPLANAASRKARMFGKPARKAVDLMLGLGLITKVAGHSYRGPTTIRATPELSKYLPLAAITWNALRLEGHAEAVVLKPRRDVGAVEDWAGRPTAKVNAVWLRTVTAEVHAINEAVLNAPIEFSGSAVAHLAERPGAAMASLVTLHHRTLRRIFSGSYEEGGRLFGHVVQTMPRGDRFKHIRIAGEPVAIVDYGQLFLRLAYAEAGAAPPPGDLYDLTGNDAAKPDWKQLREARKKLVNAMFFRRAPLAQWPGATITEIAEMRDAFPAGIKPRDAIKAIKEKHAPIAHLFERGHGLRFMRAESDLIVAVTLALTRRGVVALPIHDAVAVRRSDAETAKAIMQAEAWHRTGAEIPVEIQTAVN